MSGLAISAPRYWNSRHGSCNFDTIPTMTLVTADDCVCCSLSAVGRTRTSTRRTSTTGLLPTCLSCIMTSLIVIIHKLKVKVKDMQVLYCESLPGCLATCRSGVLGTVCSGVEITNCRCNDPSLHGRTLTTSTPIERKSLSLKVRSRDFSRTFNTRVVTMRLESYSVFIV